MNKNRRFILATLLSGTVLAAAGVIAAPLVVSDSPLSGKGESGLLTQLVDWDEEDGGTRRKDERRNHHDDEDEDEDEDDDDDDDEDGRNGRSRPSPAPVGTVAPPSNGLILQGSTPKVQVN